MPSRPDSTMARLLEIMARLRDPRTGCPWDREQDFDSIAPYTIEEAYEVADAIHRGDQRDLLEELGDLLFQVVYHARMAEEAGWFGFDDVVRAISEKLVRRHPHVFGDETVASAGEQSEAWEALKEKERAASGKGGGALDGIPVALPGLVRATKLQRRAGRVGFDWPDWHGPLEKLREETDELESELSVSRPDTGRVQDELGDILFTCCNIARHAGVDPETAVRGANVKFERRFRLMERDAAAAGRSLDQMNPAQLDKSWRAAKRDAG